jgi:hypothetical protein
VTITIITIAPNVAAPITGSGTPNALGNIRVDPIPATISPTSPRGIIPNPIDSRFRPRSATASEQICLPMIAASVSAAAKPS